MIKGLILVNKPSGITSFSAVSRIKRLAGEKRVGHTGTLDPMATGVLPIFVGRATALCSYLLEADKIYRATFLFGKTTDTYDVTGNVISESPVNFDASRLQNAIENFTGEISQVPPMYSALKKDGVPLYKLARRGEKVEIEPRKVVIYGIRVLKELENNEITLEIKCSKGTYIRSLCADMGEYLGCGATLKELCRVSTSGFDISDCVKLDDLTEDNIKNFILSEEKAVEYMRVVSVSKPQAVRFCNGGELGLERLKFSAGEDGENLRVKYGDKLLGIGKTDITAAAVKVKCVLTGSEELE
ncbi:MAG: tRNA pseudouridine(55) synthase TruB [Clostridiales bacterium]|nr:tRNA pseudouridine(55) synthase TruB [Candidatus Equinaster intestinalis]